MSEDVGKLFDGIAGGYDEEHRRAVPCSEELYGAVAGLVPAGREDWFRVLDLGSGTGLLSAAVAKAFPKAEVTLADSSKEMMNLARERFSGEPAKRFTFYLTDYVNDALPGRYGAVVSALSLHHIGDEEKRTVFRKVYEALEEGGIFVNADQFSRASANGHHRTHQGDHERVGVVGAHDPHRTHESTLEEQLGWLEGAGFTSVECTYENGRFAVCSGRKGTV